MDQFPFFQRDVFFIENTLTGENETSFKSGDFFINQFLTTTHDIYKSFDDGCEV